MTLDVPLYCLQESSHSNDAVHDIAWKGIDNYKKYAQNGNWDNGLVFDIWCNLQVRFEFVFYDDKLNTGYMHVLL